MLTETGFLPRPPHASVRPVTPSVAGRREHLAIPLPDGDTMAATPPDYRPVRDDPARRQHHTAHLDHCERTTRYTGLYFDCLRADLPRYLGAVFRELEMRAAMCLAGQPRRRVLERLYAWQDDGHGGLAAMFIQATGAESPRRLGFGHLADGHFGITDAARWQQHLDSFREELWAYAVHG